MHQSIKDLVFERMKEKDVGFIVIPFSGGNDSGSAGDWEMFKTLLDKNKEIDYEHWSGRVTINEMWDDEIERIPAEVEKEFITKVTVNRYMNKPTPIDYANLWDDVFNEYELEKIDVNELQKRIYALADYIDMHLSADDVGSHPDDIRKNWQDIIISRAMENPIDQKYAGFAGGYEVEGYVLWDLGNKKVSLNSEISYMESESRYDEF